MPATFPVGWFGWAMVPFLMVWVFEAYLRLSHRRWLGGCPQWGRFPPWGQGLFPDVSLTRCCSARVAVTHLCCSGLPGLATCGGFTVPTLSFDLLRLALASLCFRVSHLLPIHGSRLRRGFVWWGVFQ